MDTEAEEDKLEAKLKLLDEQTAELQAQLVEAKAADQKQFKEYKETKIGVYSLTEVETENRILGQGFFGVVKNGKVRNKFGTGW